jgi:hypothetical protein
VTPVLPARRAFRAKAGHVVQLLLPDLGIHVGRE